MFFLLFLEITLMVLNELSLQKFFVWFLVIMSFLFCFLFFSFDAKFQAFRYSGFLFEPHRSNKKSLLGLNQSFSNDNDRLTEYYETHKRISQMNVSLRKISFNECVQAGYGNRLYSVLSSFLIALLTNSSLVIKWKEIEPYVDLPIRVFDSNITRDVGLSKEEFEKRFYHANPAQSWSRTKNIEALMKTNVPETPLRYLYHEIGPYFMEICSNPIYFSKFIYYNLVNNETINLALEVISNKTSTHIDKQEKIFKVGFEVGGTLLNRFWRPIKSIMNDVKRFKEKYFPVNVQSPPFTVLRPPFTVHRPRSPSTVHSPPFTVLRPPFTVQRPPFNVHRSTSTVHRPPSNVNKIFLFFINSYGKIFQKKYFFF